jgi:EAL domain-containing protein (putative c-di-GMP-specific phosphodiesterase class I)
VRHVYQPIVDLHSGVVVAWEALARFHGRKPEEVLRDLAVMGDKALRAFDSASVAAAAAAARGVLPSGAQLCLNLTHATVAAAVSGEPLPDVGGLPVIWELREDEATHRVLSVDGSWRALSSRGRFALDDIGGGWADLARLVGALHHGVRWVKVDRQVVQGVGGDPARRAVLRAVTDLGFETIAEGAEDLADLAVLAASGVRYAQGYAVGRPVSGPVPARAPARIYLAGGAGSGKSTVAALLAERHGFVHAALGDFPRALAKARGLRPERAVLQALGDEIRGPDPARLARLALARVAGIERAVIDGVRLPEEAAVLRAAGFIGVLVAAEKAERQRRLHMRGEYWDDREWQHPTEKRAASIEARFRIHTNRDQRDLGAAVSRLVQAISG